MLHKVLNTKLLEYAPANAVEQDNVLQELMQLHVLASLSRAGLFNEAVFHGGTCLRIVDGLRRFSEDLDFFLKQPNPDFHWQDYLNAVQKDCAWEGIAFEIQDKSKAETAVRKAFLKTDSIGKLLILDLPFERRQTRKIRIKLEIDIDPPSGSSFSTSYITYPVTAPLTVQTLESSFALKLHAMLCRTYVKGRDWYDFVWYVARKIQPNLDLLQNALRQNGPWKNQVVPSDPYWVRDQIKARIQSIDWEAARHDVQRFLPLRDQEGLRFWSVDFIGDQLDRLFNGFKRRV